MSAKKSATSWEPVAQWYDELLAGNDTYQAKVILPNLLRLLPPAGKRVVDIACGQGFFSHAYAAAGATVTGIDVSPELVKLARARAAKGARFEVARASDMKPVPSGSMDGALIVLALQNIKEMPETLREASRVLVVGGSLVIVLNHPCFRIPKGSAWGYDEAVKAQYRRIDRYGTPFSTDIDMAPGARGAAAVRTVSFHRPLQDYVKALAGAGLAVAGLEEWISHKRSEPGPRAKAEDDARKEFPLFLAIVARKQ